MKKVVLFYLILLCIVPLMADDSLRIQRFEQEHRNLSHKVDSLSREINLQFKENISNAKEEIASIRFWGSIAATLASLGVITLLLTFAFALPKMGMKIARKYFDEHFNKQAQNIIKNIKSQERETRIKEDKTILIVVDDMALKNEAEKLVYAFDFKKVKTINHGNIDKIATHDMLLFYKLLAINEKEIILKCMKQNESNSQTLFVAYTKNNLQLGTEYIHLQDKLNFANSQFSLYFRILDCFVFQEIMAI